MIWQDRDTICGLIDSKTFKEEAVAYENHLYCGEENNDLFYTQLSCLDTCDILLKVYLL